jgi:hypothetical protein
VAEVDDLRSAGLQDAAHDVDGGIVPVEEAGGGDEADFVVGAVGLYVFHDYKFGFACNAGVFCTETVWRGCFSPKQIWVKKARSQCEGKNNVLWRSSAAGRNTGGSRPNAPVEGT